MPEVAGKVHEAKSGSSAPGAAPTRQSITVLLEGTLKATLSFHSTLFWLTRLGTSGKGSIDDPWQAFLCVPLDLILDSSLVPDSDGGTVYIRLLAPPSQKGSPLLPLAKTKSAATSIAEQDHLLGQVTDRSALSAKDRADRLHHHIEDGFCKRLRLIKIETRVHDAEQASLWVKELMRRAYVGSAPYRRLKVLVNPVGGPGKARQLFQTKVRPILEAAGCRIDVQVTERVNHGLEIAKSLAIEQYDALLTVSGDGLAHEVLNGFAQRSDAVKALQMPICPIPTGSGNGLCVNLLGPDQGFNLALASLNAIKGLALPLDICVVTQPKAAGRGSDKARHARGKVPRSRREDLATVAGSAETDPAVLQSAPELPYDQYYSFLSQAIGLMADLDLGTEHLRALGDTRFVLGFVSGVISNSECEVDIDVKLGSRGTKDKSEMRQRVKAYNETGQWSSIAEGTGAEDTALPSDEIPSLRHGTASDPLYAEGTTPPQISGVDPSWPHCLLVDDPGHAASDEVVESSESWARLSVPIATLYAGKIPFVARDLMQFPYALPGDGTIDIALILHKGGRVGKLKAIHGAETGKVVYDRSMVYLKVEAYRVTPKLPAGDPRLKQGGLVSIDGEHRPYAPFQVEVSAVQAHTLSLFGRFNVHEVDPPSVVPIR
ncbi:unnamed protein product [Parajaminaea phylloscopi]